MAVGQDPTDPIRRKAATFPSVDDGTSCNQSSFKVGKSAFLYIGPGAKGQGFKAMFKLERSMPQAHKLAAEQPQRFEVGSSAWVTTRFSAEQPLPESIWEKWLSESYELARGPGPKDAKSVAKKATKKKTTRRPATKKTAKKRPG